MCILNKMEFYMQLYSMLYFSQNIVFVMFEISTLNLCFSNVLKLWIVVHKYIYF